MAATWYLVIRRLRRRPGAAVAVALLIALTSGSVTGLVAAARRASAAFPAFVERARPDGDVTVFAQLDDQVPFEADDQAALHELLVELPEVERSVRGTLLIAEATHRDGERQRLLASVTLEPGSEAMLGRPLVVDGALPDVNDPDAIAIDEELASRARVTVGDTLELAPYTVAQFGPAGQGADVRPEGPSAHLRVEAIVRYPIDLQPADLDQRGIYVDHSDVQLTPAYWDRYGPDLARYGVGAVVELRDGATAADLEVALQERIPDRFLLEYEPLRGGDDAFAGIERALDIEARGVVAVAAVTGLAGAVVLWLVLGRGGADQRRDDVLEAIGLTVGGRRAVQAAEGLVLGTCGAVLGVLVAWITSAWTPFGTAGRAELDPGTSADLTVLGIGFAATVVSVPVVSLAAQRRRRPSPTKPRRSLIALASVGVPPVPLNGLRYALVPSRDGRGVPVRSALLGVALASVVTVAAVVVAASLDKVREDPELRGAYWDASVGNAGSKEAAAGIEERLRANPDVAAFAGETWNEMRVDGQLVSVLAHFDRSGGLDPIVVEGRSPEGSDEIAVGARVMDRLDLEIGDVVQVAMASAGDPQPMTVVGRALVEDVEGSIGAPGKAASVSADALADLDPLGLELTSPTWYTLRFAPGVDEAAAVQRLEAQFPLTVTTPRMPSDLRNLERITPLVALLAVLVGALGAAAALFAMVGAVTQGRRDLAIMRTLGLVRRQAGATVAWQATALAAAGLLVGLPAGIVAGRWIWVALADGVGLASGPVVPVGGVLVLAGAVLGLLNGVASLPAARARRLRPSVILRAE